MDLPPLDVRPQRIVALGLTWRSHARETGERLSPDGPPRFVRDPASLADGGRIVLPSRARIQRMLDAVEPGLGAELASRQPKFEALRDGDVRDMEGGPLGSVRAVVEAEAS